MWPTRENERTTDEAVPVQGYGTQRPILQAGSQMGDAMGLQETQIEERDLPRDLT